MPRLFRFPVKHPHSRRLTPVLTSIPRASRWRGRTRALFAREVVLEPCAEEPEKLKYVGASSGSREGMATFDFVSGQQFRASLEADYQELLSAMGVQAYKAEHVLAGSIIEALLVDYLIATDYQKRK